MVIDVDKFVASLIKYYCEAYFIDRTSIRCWFDDVLEEQGLEYKDGKIVKTQRVIAAEAKKASFDNEVEDEKIRKDLIEWFEEFPDMIWRGHYKKDVLAWLEKQDDNLVKNGYTDNKDFIKYADNYSHEIWHKLMDNFKNIKDYYIGCNDVSDIVLNAIIDTCNWLEKQGDKKTAVVDFNAKDWYVSKVDGRIHDMTYNPTDKVEPKFKVKYAGSEYNVLEVKDIAGVTFYGIEDEPNHIDYVKADNYEIISGYGIKENGSPYPTKPSMFSEQKPADNVETKFKVGNWYQCTKDFFGKGVTFDKNTAYYCAKEGCLQNEYGCHIAIVKDLYDNFKLWVIQDAKDGDVLVNGSNIFIFHFIDGTRLMGYCHVNTDDGRFYDDIGKIECFCLIDAIVNPATKEQRDTLEKAMADAGYIFDFENKELKKIEKKTAWSDEDEEELGIAVQYLQKAGQFDSVNWLKSLKTRTGG